jgi:hypothetical protein
MSFSQSLKIVRRGTVRVKGSGTCPEPLRKHRLIWNKVSMLLSMTLSLSSKTRLGHMSRNPTGRKSGPDGRTTYITSPVLYRVLWRWQ